MSRPRPKVKRNAERALWGEAFGHCMNPDCHRSLIEKGTSIGQMAHIRPYADGGQANSTNLILLCSVCHGKLDQTSEPSRSSTMRKWKRDRHDEIQRRFTRRYPSFAALSAAVRPMLIANRRTFDDYGPLGTMREDTERFSLWMRSEPAIIANNHKILSILRANINLLAKANHVVVDDLEAHIKEFDMTRDDALSYRTRFFPDDLDSIFGIEPTRHSRPSENTAALENLIAKLQSESRFIGIDLVDQGLVTYVDSAGEPAALSIYDVPRMYQEFWSNRCYPAMMHIRLSDLIWILDWMRRSSIRWSIPDPTRLTEVLVGARAVKFIHKYIATVADIHEVSTTGGLTIVNTNEWGSGGFTGEALEFADRLGNVLMTRSEFFSVARRF